MNRAGYAKGESPVDVPEKYRQKQPHLMRMSDLEFRRHARGWLRVLALAAELEAGEVAA